MLIYVYTGYDLTIFLIRHHECGIKLYSESVNCRVNPYDIVATGCLRTETARKWEFVHLKGSVSSLQAKYTRY